MNIYMLGMWLVLIPGVVSNMPKEISGLVMWALIIFIAGII